MGKELYMFMRIFYLELLKEQRNNYNEKDIRKSNDGKYNTWTDEVCDNK
ncbi:MAG: hypothetical protein ACLRU5_10210 [Lachnospira eligens]